jgi:hypothetical protein
VTFFCTTGNAATLVGDESWMDNDGGGVTG